MNKIFLIAGAAVIIVVGALFFTNDNSSSPSIDKVSVNMESDDNYEFPEDSLSDTSVSKLIETGENIKCEFSKNEPGVSMMGVFYISGKDKKVRGEFTLAGSGQVFKGSTIQRDGMVYTWGSTQFGKFATKAKVGEKKKENGKSIDFDEEMGFNCSEWKVDQSMFELPKDVNFEDIEPQLKKIDDVTQQLNDIRCNACNDVTDEAGRAQCKAMFNCG